MNRRVVYNKFKNDHVDVKIGIAMPFNGKGVFKSTSTTAEQIKYNLINLLLTSKGERLFDPDFGCDLKRMVFDPITNPDAVERLIEPQIERYLNSIELVNVSVDTTYKEYTAIINIEYKIKHTSETDTLDIAI